MELVVAMLIVGILAVVAMPKLELMMAPSGDAARETVLAALRQARTQAYAHRRLVCASASGSSLTVVQATSFPATACTGTAVLSPSGQANFLAGTVGAAISASPSATLHFQPNGTVTTDAAGANLANFTLSISAAGQAPVTVNVAGQGASAN